MGVRQDVPLAEGKFSDWAMSLISQPAIPDSFMILPNHRPHACPRPLVQHAAVPILIPRVTCVPHIEFGIVANYTGRPGILGRAFE